MHSAARLVVLISFLGLPRLALADVAACVQAHASGQREAKAGRLEAASKLFASCVSEDGCPDTIRAECAEYYKSTERNIPTLIFAAIDGRGGDLIDVRVLADDRVLTETLDGRPIALDPGEHHFEFQLASGEVLASDVLVRQGEKNRIVSMQAKLATKASAEASASNAKATGTPRLLPKSFWIASGVSAAALVSFGVFAGIGSSKQATLNECSPNCSGNDRADYDAMRRDYLIADISLGVAVAAAGAATWLFLTSGRSDTDVQHAASSAFSGVTLTPMLSTRGAGLALGARAF